VRLLCVRSSNQVWVVASANSDDSNPFRGLDTPLFAEEEEVLADFAIIVFDAVRDRGRQRERAEGEIGR